jgi:disulfide bond formation protein DsbB
LAIVFLGSTLITAYHVAVEHEWVPSPTACQSDLKINKTTTIQDLRVQLLEESRVTPCHIAPIKILGSSLAEYNLLLSLGLVVFCLLKKKS